MRKRLYEGDHPDIASSLGSLGVAYFDGKKLRDQGNGKELLKQAYFKKPYTIKCTE